MRESPEAETKIVRRGGASEGKEKKEKNVGEVWYVILATDSGPLHTVNVTHRLDFTDGMDGGGRRMLSRSRAAQTEPWKQVGAGASSSASAASQAKKIARRDEV